MKRIAIALIMSAVTLSGQAQTVISGHVTDSIGQPIQAFVTLTARGETSAADFADADAKGFYRLEYDGEADSLVIRASDMTFGNLVKIIANRTQTVNFRARGSFELKEVIVKAEKIRQSGDTLSYNVASYRGQEDRLIADVLKKMPGIEVDDNGAIKFNGKAIKNFYVEDMNLLQSRYGIATNNISAQDVTVVQVLQNHQPIRALKDIRPTDDVSINLKLRKEAKGTWAMNGMAGGGTALKGFGDRAMLAGELVAMYFGRTMQNMTTYKGNNAGIDIAGEVAEHGGSGYLFAGVPLSVQQPSSPGLSAKRYRQNRSHVASANQIFKIDSISNIVFNAVYQNERLSRMGESVSDYYLSAGERLKINEEVRSVSHSHRLDFASKYEYNAAQSYVTDNLRFNSSWSDAEAVGTTDGRSVNQHLKTPGLTLTNDFRLLKNVGNRSFNLNCRAGYNQKPYQLAAAEYCQDYTARNVLANLNSSYGWRWGKFRLDYILTGDVNLQNVGSELDGPTPTLPSREGERQVGILPLEGGARGGLNDYWFNTYTVSVDQFMHLDLRHWYFSLNAALSSETQQLDDRAFGNCEAVTSTNVRERSVNRRTWSYVFLRPTAEVKYILGQSWFTLTSSYYHVVDNSQQAARGVVMHSYRSFQRSIIDEASRQQTLNNSLSFYHKNAHRQFFLNGSASWLHSRSGSVTGIDYEGAQMVCRVLPFEHGYDRLNFSAETSKGFDLWRSTVKLVGNYGLTETQQLIQGRPTDVRTDYWSASAYVVASPAGWLSVAAAYAFGQSRSMGARLNSEGVTSRRRERSVNTSTTRLDLNFLPHPRLVLNIAAEDNYNNMTQTNRHAWFGDAKVKYKTRLIDYELELNNLFNQRLYTRTAYNDLDIFTTTTHLRPFNVLLKLRFKIL